MTGGRPVAHLPLLRPPRRLISRLLISPLEIFRRDTIALVAFATLVAIVAIALLAPVISPYPPDEVTTDVLQSPSWAHPFGTDQFGRDVLSRVIWGARLTLLAAVVGVGISAGIGVPFGLVAGYTSRWASPVIMRAMDVLLAFPGLLLALVIIAITGTGLTNVMIAIGVAFIPIFARLVYGSTLAVKANDYVAAARLTGSSSARILGRHVLPNVASQIVVVASSAFGWAILTATTLNFLGFGVKPPTPEWGADLAVGKDWLSVAWWISTFPGLAITITILAVSFLGDHVAAMLEPRARQSGMAPKASEIAGGTELVGIGSSKGGSA